MGTIIRRIIGVVIALVGLAIVGLGIYAIALGSALWWGWLLLISLGLYIAILGLLLVASFKDFFEGLKSSRPPF